MATTTTVPSTLQEAIIVALAEMPNPVKNASNPAFKRDGKPMKYADLEATLDACKPILAANKVALLQFPVSSERGLGVHTKLIGYGEEMDCGEFYLPLEGQTPQKAAGAITYARRYALTSIFGLAQEDDDGNAASTATTPPTDAERYPALMKLANEKGNLEAVKTMLGNPENAEAGYAAFCLKSDTEKAALEFVARNGGSAK